MGRVDTREQDCNQRVLGYSDYDVRLGDEMRGRRATLGKSLLDVENDLHIRASYVDAIEKADPLSFEVNWVIPGYVKSYARYLGMDPEDAYRRFCTECGFEMESHKLLKNKGKSGKKAERKRKKARDRRIVSRGWWPTEEGSIWKVERLTLEALGSTMLLVGVGVAIIYFGFVFFGEVRRTVNADIDPAAGSLSTGIGTSAADALDKPVTEAASAETGRDRVFVPGAISAIAPDQVGMYRDTNTLAATPVADARPDEAAVDLSSPAPEDFDLPSAAPTTAESGTVAAHGSDRTTDPPASDPEPALAGRVFLVPVRESWIRITDELATTYAEGLLQAGDVVEVPATDSRPLLRAGNAGSLYFVVEGEVFGPAGNGGAVISEVDLSPGSIRENFPRLDQENIPKEIQEIVRSSIGAGQAG